MNNNLNNLNNYFFEELERLNDDDELEGEKLDRELKRAKAISTIGIGIINNAKVILDAKKYADECGINNPNELLRLNEKSMD